MRLSKIKLAGFKSFVDPITVPFPSQLMGIVGPNGCGKSNIIDAVRWVMGEGSAKNLRGDSMADVIFNGSAGRKPVGHASVELVFDNSEGKFGGEYAQYAEISIKRVVSRDGTSNYFLNNGRCRRKDITDIFHGTGLGPRSYSIIEQGMISRLIEARPEDLRGFLEEAAGISRYKERRRETETRIKHTRENLARLDDLRGEIEAQLSHLNRQARAAERYKLLKEEERSLRAELLALRWRTIERESADKRAAISAHETGLEAAIAEQRRIETAIEHARSEQATTTDHFGKVQGRFYGVGADIARLEQEIQHTREVRHTRQQDLERVEAELDELQEQLKLDRERLQDHDHFLARLAPELARLRGLEQEADAALETAEGGMQSWRQRWESFTREAGEPAREAEVERTRLDHLEQEQREQADRNARLEAELERILPQTVEREHALLEARGAELERQASESQRRLAVCNAALAGLRDEERTLSAELDAARNAVQQIRGRLASMEMLQQAALGQADGAVMGWLKARQLDGKARLGGTLRVAAGWERAVETVLGDWLEAVCVEDLDAVTPALGSLTEGAVTLFRAQAPGPGAAVSGLHPLADKVEGEVELGGLFDGVFAVADIASAMRHRSQLAPGQSLVTPDGVWLGQGWLRVVREGNAHAGVLARADAIRELESERDAAVARVGALEKRHDAQREQMADRESERDDLQTAQQRAHRESVETAATLKSRREQAAQLETRRTTLAEEIASLAARAAERDGQIRAARQRLEQAIGRMAGFERERERLDADRERLHAALEAARGRVRSDSDATHGLALQGEARRSARDALAANVERMTIDLGQLGDRRDTLVTSLEDGDQPLEEHQRLLADSLDRRGAIEGELATARQAVETVETTLRELEQRRHAQEQRVVAAREALQEAKLGVSEQKVRQQTLTEQLDAAGVTLDETLARLAEEADVPGWEEKLARVEARALRLEPVNLAAISEFEEQSRRKEYLDAQHNDLMEALDTLEGAIRKIDRETRARFKDTFDRVNSGLQAAFPKLFGGGHAYLELTGDDLLDTGVTVMAQPPGKRNSTIHLLSGGEKALTAVALVFSIFELNPSPFCMLDEVDAPLDDHNVGRFCELVREMSKRVQFIMITHNKLTMELAQQLTGVTMQEAGVSRLVAVDIDEAVHLAAI